MAGPEDALRKATGIEAGTSRGGEMLQSVIEALVGALGLSNVPVPTAQGPHALGDTRAGRFGEMVGAAAGLPIIGAAKRISNPIRAYHGSPHDFDKFSLSKIGTGEGAQAYGHGLYFAEQEATARNYRDMLSGKTLGGSALNWDDPVEVASMRVHQFSGDTQQAIDFLASRRPNPSISEANAQAAKFTDEAIAAIRDGRATNQVDPGRMYEVNINADPESLLDWDAPLSGQSPTVQEAFTRAYGKSPDQLAPLARGEHAYKMAGHGSDVQSAETLKRAGIPGLKYLDQGSRAAGEGSRNYVVFDDSLIDILRKYGVVLPLAGAGAASQGLFDDLER